MPAHIVHKPARFGGGRRAIFVIPYEIKTEQQSRASNFTEDQILFRKFGEALLYRLALTPRILMEVLL